MTIAVTLANADTKNSIISATSFLESEVSAWACAPLTLVKQG